MSLSLPGPTANARRDRPSVPGLPRSCPQADPPTGNSPGRGLLDNKPRPPACRLQHWLNAENLRQSDSCPGCNSPMPLVPETLWSYRLNPLIHHCVNHNVLAVWHALQELSHRMGSFFYTPSSELHFAQPINGKPKRELDVLCVTDGELLLGEVKTGVLAEKYFEDFGAIA